MAGAILHSTPADGTFSSAGAIAWDAGHNISGLVQSPASSIDNILCVFDGITGEFIKTSGLLYALNTASPNATVPVVSLTAYDTGYTNIDFACVPKGTGAFILDVPDGTATGGNKRGTNAIDLQLRRANATQVASGSDAITIGRSNTAGNDAIAMGLTNNVSNDQGIGIGGNNDNAALAGTTIGDSNNLGASATSSVAIGLSNTITGPYSFSIGRLNSITVRQSAYLGVKGSITATGGYAYGMGYSVSLAGYLSAGFGGYQTATADADRSAMMGWYLKVSASKAYVFGCGVSGASRLDNNVANSIWFGVNTTVPSLAVWNGGGFGGFGKVSVGSATEPTDDCLFEVASTTKGSRPIPKMTTAQRDAIATPSSGMFVYNTDTNQPNFYTTSWRVIEEDVGYLKEFLLMGA